MDGKSKDGTMARLDLEFLKIREDQHAKPAGKDKYTMKKGVYALKKEEKMMLFRFLQSIRMPDGYGSHIKRCVVLEQCKFTGLKTHDCNVILQKLLPSALRKLLPQNVLNPLLQLSKFFSRSMLQGVKG